MKILPPSTYNNRIPSELEPVVLRALSRDVDQRYRTAGEFGSHLQRFLITQEKVFGPTDLAEYMHKTFAEELAKEKVKAAEGSKAVARKTPGPGIRGSPSGRRASPSASSLPARASGSGRIAELTIDPGQTAPPGIRGSPTPGTVRPCRAHRDPQLADRRGSRLGRSRRTRFPRPPRSRRPSRAVPRARPCCDGLPPASRPRPPCERRCPRAPRGRAACRRGSSRSSLPRPGPPWSPS